MERSMHGGFCRPDLPAPASPSGSYRTVVRAGDYIHLSGTGSPPIEGVPPRGRIGLDVTAEQAYQLARGAAAQLVGTLRGSIADLTLVEQCVRLTVFLACDERFTGHAAVADGATDFLVEVFGERGRPVRTTVGVHTLPFGIPVEADLTVYAPLRVPGMEVSRD